MTVTEAVRLYPVSAVADLLGTSRQHVYNLINAGTLRVVELGTTRPKQRVRADELQRYIDSRTF